MHNVNSDFPNLPFCSDDLLHPSDQEIQNIHMQLEHLFRGRSVKTTAPAFEWRSVYPEGDTNLHSQSIVQKVVAVVLDEEQDKGNDISSGAEKRSQLDPFAPDFFPKENRICSFDQHIQRMNEISFCLTEHWNQNLSEIDMQLVQSFPDILASMYRLLEQSDHAVEKNVLKGKSRLERAKVMVNGVFGELDRKKQKQSIQSKFAAISPNSIDGQYRVKLGVSIATIVQNLKELQ